MHVWCLWCDIFGYERTLILFQQMQIYSEWQRIEIYLVREKEKADQIHKIESESLLKSFKLRMLRI